MTASCSVSFGQVACHRPCRISPPVFPGCHSMLAVLNPWPLLPGPNPFCDGLQVRQPLMNYFIGFSLPDRACKTAHDSLTPHPDTLCTWLTDLSAHSFRAGGSYSSLALAVPSWWVLSVTSSAVTLVSPTHGETFSNARS
jgi:hypothetical protein